MKELFDAIQNSRHKKLIILLLIVFILAVNLIEPWFILNKGYFGEDFLILSTLVGLVTVFCVIFILLLIVKDNFFGCIILCCLPIIALFVSRNLSVPINKIAKKILWAETYAEVTEVKMKKQKKWRFKHHSEDVYYLYVNSKATCNKPIVIGKDIYDSINKGDTIIINISKRNHNIWRTRDLHPASEEVKELYIRQKLMNRGTPPIIAYDEYSVKNMDSLLFDSHCQVGTVYAKADDEHYRHIVKVGVDSLHTTTHEFIGRATVYQRLNIGDKVILQVSDSLPEINRVINWQPTEAEIMQYQQPQPFDEKMIVKDYSRCTKEFEIENLHKSHKRIGIIYDKYEDDYVGAYLEVGIDEKHTRTHLFHTYNESEMKIYNEASVGDTVLVRVSDALPQLNRVLNWQPTPEEKKKYKTPVRLMELLD